jgi:hypothetical protein
MDESFLGKGILQLHPCRFTGNKVQSRPVIGTGKAEHGRGAAIDLNRPRYNGKLKGLLRGTICAACEQQAGGPHKKSLRKISAIHIVAP